MKSTYKHFYRMGRMIRSNRPAHLIPTPSDSVALFWSDSAAWMKAAKAGAEAAK